MPEDWRVKQRERADAALARLLERYPDCAVERNPVEWLMGTHCVTFGTFTGQRVAIKYYDWAPRKEREEASLKLYAPTGLVPGLWPVESETILVMDRLRGEPLHEIEKTTSAETMQHLYRQVGHALAKIARFAPRNSAAPAQPKQAKSGIDYVFYCSADLPTLFDTVTMRSAQVLAEQDVPDKLILQDGLTNLLRNREALLTGPPFIQMDDFHANNILAEGDALSGFIDLEMTRFGNEILQLAAAIHGPWWKWIRLGYEEERGRALSADELAQARVAAPFSTWTRFMWYWTGDPAEQEPGMRESSVRTLKQILETVRREAEDGATA